jgi:hypothetical protein
MAARAIETGECDLTIAIGMDKHPRGAFAADPSVAGLPAWHGQTGLYLTTHFFGMKIDRYMHDHGITEQTLARAAAENIQVHGGIGFTWEHPAHLYFRRAKSSELLFGGPAVYHERLLDRLGI